MSSSDLSRVARLIWEMDNRSAVTGLTQIGDESKKTRDSLSEDADVEAASMDHVRESSERLRGALVGLASFVGIGGVAFGLKDMVQGGESLQEQQADLQAALKATGQEAGDAGDKLEKYAEELSTRGGFGTTENLSALTAFVRETHSATEAQNMLTLATNIARGRSMDLASAQTIVARAYTGSTAKLQQILGPMVAAREAQVGLTTAHQQTITTLENEASMMGSLGQRWLRQQEVNDHITAQQSELAELTDKHATATQALAAATQLFGGYAQNVFSNTNQGRVSDLKNAFHNMTDELGKGLLPAEDELVSIDTKLAEEMAKHKSLVRDLAIGFAGLGAAMGMRKGLKAIHGLFDDLGKLVKAFPGVGAAGQAAGDEAALGADEASAAWRGFLASTIVGIGLVALVELAEHWKEVKKIAVDVWHDIEHAARDVWDWLRDHWRLLAVIFAGPLAPLVLMIEHLRTILRVAEEVGRTVGGAFGGVERFVTHPFGLSFANGGQLPKYFAGGGPFGTDTVPFWGTPGEGIVDTTGMGMIGGASGLAAINSGQWPSGAGGGVMTIRNAQPINLSMDSRVFLRAMVMQVLNDAARGTNTAAVGGSLMTNSIGLLP